MRRSAIVASIAGACLVAGAMIVPARARAASARHPVAGAHTGKTSAHGKKRYSKRTPVQRVPTPGRITEIQSALARGGYYQDEPSGKWDSTTVAAMQKFQSSNGLDATGKIDALSLQKLGLGSSIAGVSRPKPSVPQTAVPSTPPVPQGPAGLPGSASSSSVSSDSASARSTAASTMASSEALVQK